MEQDLITTIRQRSKLVLEVLGRRNLGHSLLVLLHRTHALNARSTLLAKEPVVSQAPGPH